MSGRDVVDHDDGEGEAEDDDGPITEITVFLILGAGLIGLFADVDWFWMIWIVGFAAVLPIVAVLEERIYRAIRGGRHLEPDHHDRRSGHKAGPDDALETLKRRYAEGEIDDVEFERRLERLVENEDIDDVERRVGDDTAPSRGTDRDYDREFDLE